MYKKYLCLVIVILLNSGMLFAQNAKVAAKPTQPPPLALREVSGIVTDSTEMAVIGATVTITTAKDTIRTSTNSRGIFIFKNVKQAIFLLSVKGIGYTVLVKKYLLNDLTPKLVLDPIILRTDNRMLNEVKIDGVPTIIFKTDTAEFKASDYKVRENATVDELLKKMDGVEVGRNGSLSYQGQEVKKAKVNGKTFAGGNVAQAIQNLPANIVDKAQFIDDYGEQAARTGIKDGDPEKVLNITTLANKSIGNIARITAGAGNDDRYDERLFLQRINANQQLGFIGKFQNTLNGVASNGGSGSATPGSNYGAGGGTGGTTTVGQPSFNYRDQWSKKIQVNTSYTYNYNNVDLINNSSGQTFSSNQTTNFNNQSDRKSNSKNHGLYFEFEFTPDSADYLQITPSFNYSGLNSSNNFQQSYTGYLNKNINGVNNSVSTAPTYSAQFFYQRLFKKPKRNLSLVISLLNSNQQNTNNNNNELVYKDALQTELRDSLQHLIVSRGSINKSYRANFTYVEPLTKTTLIGFTAQVSYRGYDNTATTDSVTTDITKTPGILVPVPALSNIFNYSFTETRLALNYRIIKTKYSLSLGFTAIPTVLQGTQVSLNASTYRTNFNLIPVFRYEYIFSQTQRFSINYSGSNTEPTFNQIQPVTDKSDPQNVIVGNPDLKPSFRNAINLAYNNYISNSKLTLSANATTSFINNNVVTNVVQVPIPALNSYYNEYHYLNLNGAYSASGNYTIAKQYNDRKYNLSLNGSVAYNHNITLSNNIQYQSSSWLVSERFGPRLNPAEWIEINPYVSYSVSRTFFTQPNSRNTDLRTTALSVDGVMYINKWHIGYDASKNYQQGISANLASNPFILDAYFERTFFKKNNGTLRLQVFDVFKQNNFTNESVTEYSITDTKTNTLSRYVFVSFILNLQKWSGTPKKNGTPMLRRGDGSFIY